MNGGFHVWEIKLLHWHFGNLLQLCILESIVSQTAVEECEFECVVSVQCYFSKMLKKKNLSF